MSILLKFFLFMVCICAWVVIYLLLISIVFRDVLFIPYFKNFELPYSLKLLCLVSLNRIIKKNVFFNVKWYLFSLKIFQFALMSNILFMMFLVISTFLYHHKFSSQSLAGWLNMHKINICFNIDNVFVLATWWIVLKE